MGEADDLSFLPETVIFPCCHAQSGAVYFGKWRGGIILTRILLHPVLIRICTNTIWVYSKHTVLVWYIELMLIPWCWCLHFQLHITDYNLSNPDQYTNNGGNHARGLQVLLVTNLVSFDMISRVWSVVFIIYVILYDLVGNWRFCVCVVSGIKFVFDFIGMSYTAMIELMYIRCNIRVCRSLV